MENLELISVSENDYLNGMESYNYYYNAEDNTIENKYDIFTIEEFIEILAELNGETLDNCFINYENITKAIKDMVDNNENIFNKDKINN